MRRIVSVVGTAVGSGIGWWLGARVGPMTAVCLSALGAGAGLYAGIRFWDRYF